MRRWGNIWEVGGDGDGGDGGIGGGDGCGGSNIVERRNNRINKRA